MATTTHYKDIVKEMKKEVDTFFEKYDGDRSKTISRDELIAGFKREGVRRPERTANRLFTKADGNRDNELSIDEMKNRIKKLHESEIHDVLDKDVEKFFKLNDKDGDKKVTKAELIERFTNSGALDPEAIANAIFKQMDLNSDGLISPSEVRAFNMKKKFTLVTDSARPSQ